ncbi:MAG: T9SS type A sorting domain-containing protein [Ignavibacteriales bacterium]|nr:T9SS type A sorting domain-containing protein [Ignavibacteriales bacterium]
MVNRKSPQADSSIWEFGYNHVLENNLSYEAGSSDTAYIDTSKNTLSHNSFDSGFNLTDKDFVSLDESQLMAQRKSDGSLPDIDFMKPATGSKLIDAGVYIGFPFAGKAPDIGALETYYLTFVKSLKNTAPENIVLHQNYPNPFNPVTNIVYEIPFSANVQLSIYNMLGQKVNTLVNETEKRGTYRVQFEGSSLSSGVYFYRLTVSGTSMVKQFILLH